MLENLNKEYPKVSIDEAFEKEMEINKFRNKMRKAHFKSVERKDYTLKSGIAYNEMFLLLERAANHVLNVTRAITGEVSKDDEDESMPQAAMDR
jgi:phosphate:Na+ symporter